MLPGGPQGAAAHLPRGESRAHLPHAPLCLASCHSGEWPGATAIGQRRPTSVLSTRLQAPELCWLYN